MDADSVHQRLEPCGFMGLRGGDLKGQRYALGVGSSGEACCLNPLVIGQVRDRSARLAASLILAPAADRSARLFEPSTNLLVAKICTDFVHAKRFSNE